MMLKSLSFTNYKGFKEKQEIQIKPVTIIIGKNSSGKSSICKLFPILRDGLYHPEQSFPLISEEGIRLSHTYSDLFHNHDFTNLEFNLKFEKVTVNLEYLMYNGEFINKESGKARKNIFHNFRDEKIPNLNVAYIGPIRSENIESFNKYESDNICKKDKNGGQAYGYLLKSYLDDNVLLDSVSAWLYENMDQQRLIFQETDTTLGNVTPLIEHNNVRVHISEVGEGIKQVLPIIVESFQKTEGRITVLEQPALHLHPSIHGKISERLIQSTQETGQKYVIETHSKTLLLGFIRMITKKDSTFSKENLAIYYIDDESEFANIEHITVDEEGSFSKWPSGLFEDDFELQEKIIERI